MGPLELAILAPGVCRSSARGWVTCATATGASFSALSVIMMPLSSVVVVVADAIAATPTVSLVASRPSSVRERSCCCCCCCSSGASVLSVATSPANGVTTGGRSPPLSSLSSLEPRPCNVSTLRGLCAARLPPWPSSSLLSSPPPLLPSDTIGTSSSSTFEASPSSVVAGKCGSSVVGAGSTTSKGLDKISCCWSGC